MWRWVVAVGLALERFTHERRLVFVVVTLVALVPATILYDQANRSTQGVRSLAANLGERLLTPQVRAAGPDALSQNQAVAGPIAGQTIAGPTGADLQVADPRLREIIANWPNLSTELQIAVLAVVQSSRPQSRPSVAGTASPSVPIDQPLPGPAGQ